jgi:hypothetical protein
MPASLFYQYASGTLLERPEGVPAWVPDKDADWSSVSVDVALPYEVFCRRVETSPEIARLAELAAGFGDVGRPVLIRAFTRALNEQLGLPSDDLTHSA